MFSSSQLHALIFLAGMLSTRFLAIGNFWEMKWNSLFEDKHGIFFDFSLLVLSIFFELPTFLSSIVSYLFGFLLAGLYVHWVILCKSLSYTSRYDDSFTLFLFYEWFSYIYCVGKLKRKRIISYYRNNHQHHLGSSQMCFNSGN